MSIIRAPRPESNFYMLNKSISEDERLSWAARGMLIFLLGKPDNWEVSVRHLINQTQDAVGKASGRDAVRVILKELEDVGYLKADFARSEGGAFNGMAYTVSEIATPKTENPAPDEPEAENPAPGKPAPENPHLIRTELQQHTESEARTDGSKRTAAQFDMSCFPEQPSTQVWADYLKHRKAKRAPISQTVINTLAKELTMAAAAGWSVDDALAEAMAAGWHGLKASWLINRAAGAGRPGVMSKQAQIEARNRQAAEDFVNGGVQ